MDSQKNPDAILINFNFNLKLTLLFNRLTKFIISVKRNNQV